MTEAEADCTGGTVSEATEVAVMVTNGLADQGAAFGAVKLTEYVTELPLVDCPVEVNVPQLVATVQVAVQVSPPEAISLVTVALKVAATPAVIVVGLPGESITAIAGRMVIDAVPLPVGSSAGAAIDVAVTVTGLGDGIVPGAV